MTVPVLRALWILFAISASAAHGQAGPGFNHASTGFLLDGIHARLQCVDCHKTGVPSRGIPKDCNGCHIQGGLRASTFQLTNHIPNFPGQSCQDCHTQTSWTPALMRHSTVMQGQCLRCHNGAFVSVNAMTKPTTGTHPLTTASCDACHTTGAFLPVKAMVHDATTVGRCSTCHDGRIASGKSAAHIQTNAQCDTCHTSTVTWRGAQYLHDPSTWGRCSQCHNGQTARGQPTTHVPSNPTQCDSCHTNQITFAAVAMNHTGMTGKCSTCHGGAYVAANAQAKPVTHVPTTAQCDSSGCHASTTTWAGVIYSHTAPGTTYTGNCSTCHVAGGAGLAKPGSHIPTTMQCDTCHNNFVTFRPAVMSHTGATGQCSNCHNATYASLNAAPLVTPPHIPDARQCDTCHTSTVIWTQRTMNHTGKAGQCSTCHGGGYTSENAQTVPVSGHQGGYPPAQCDNSGCHASTTTWVGVIYSHTDPTKTYVNNCTSCHASGPGLTKPTNHIPVTQQCDTCHKNYTAFRPAQMSHTGQTTCSNCHNGSYLAQNALTKPANHVTTGAVDCNNGGCHTSTTTWTGVIYSHTVPGTTYAGNCSTCHVSGGPGLAKPAVHIPTLVPQCDNCHTNYTAFKPAQMNHTGAGACSTCHGSTTYLAQNALTKPASHVPTAAECDSSGCHSSTTTWTGVIYSHTAPGTTYTGNCASCHTPGGSGLSKPTPHVPTTAQCDTCHTNYTAFKPAQMNHTGTAGACATCHSGTYAYANAQTRGTGHIIDARSCDTCHLNFVAFSPATMNHTGLNGKCSTCHSGAYLSENAQMKPATHTPTSAQCDTSGCHASTTTWAGVAYSHTDPTKVYAGNCTSCHASGPGLTKPTNHVPTTQQCDTCHTNYTAFKPAFMNHTGTAGQCNTCHNGSYVFARADKQGATHIPDARQCDTCHTSTIIWTQRLFVHPANAAGGCSNCHSGQYLTENAQTKTATHVPTTAQCDSSGCHASLTTWSGVTYSHTDPSKTYVANCSSCHVTGGPGLPKPTPHVPTTQQCDTCHTNYVSFKPAFMKHTGTTGQCNTCHISTYAYANANALVTPPHIPETRQCDVCHTSTVIWTQRTMNHTGKAGQCSTCHGGGYTSENAQTVPVSGHQGGYPPAQCDNSGCHASTTTWAGVIYSHTDPTKTYVNNCTSCHASGPGLTKPTNHIPVTQQCDTCHKNYTAFKPAQMSHTGQTTCSNCHNGSYLAQNALTKPATHVATGASDCNASGCHTSTTTWTGVVYSHTVSGQVYVANCSTCHVSGGPGLAKPAVHIPDNRQCDTCHTNYTAFKPAQMNHTGLAGQCSNCHGSTTYLAQNALTKPANHVPTSAQCDSSGCHNSTDTWTGANYQHTDSTKTYTNNCSSCHTAGGSGLAKPSGHIPDARQCDVCHKNYASFKPAQMDHTGTATLCSNCHNATYASTNANPQGTTHIPTTAQCDKCHNSFAGWTGRVMDHTQVTSPASCTTCHGGAYLSENAQKMGSGHIPIGTNQCSACHTSYAAFSPATMNHTAVVATACATCHGGAYVAANAQTKPTGHLVTTAACNSSGCHSGYTTWAITNIAHTPAFAGICNTCHLPGSTPSQGLTKPSNHIPAGNLQCDQCHNMSPSLFKPIKKPMNHAAVSATPCANCHNATYAYTNANAQGTTHIPTALACTNCHKTGFVDWTVTPANMDHTGQAGKCATCHSGGYLTENAQAKGSGHLPENRQCDVCHTSFLNWTTGTYVHPTTAPGTCKSCHDNPVYAAEGFTAAGVIQKTSVNHIPFESSILSGSSMSCEACHTGGFTNWTSEKMNHNNSQGNGSGFCKNCHATGVSYAGSMQKKSLTHQSSGKTDCSVSGCHKPLGSKGTAYSKWN